ncbi:MAG: ANTAR domain-containing response regulator [Faecousia sp.]
MVFQEKTYSVLVVSSTTKFNEAIAQMLPVTDFYPVSYAGNVAAARRELLGRTYDFVIINAPLPDDFGTRLAIDAVSGTSTAVLLLARAEMIGQIDEKVTPQGVFTLSKPTSTQSLQQALKWMAASRERLRKMEKKATSIEEKMEEIRLVNRAKWLLIEQLKMTEADAHHYIERQAMDRCISRREIALGIIKTYA